MLFYALKMQNIVQYEQLADNSSFNMKKTTKLWKTNVSMV